MLKIFNNNRAREGFSIAEMLMVLLIISFLILAIPPIIHKKYEKRVNRGEHGRYECWVTTDGQVREFYATEKNGIEDPAYINAAEGGTEKEPLGKVIGTVAGGARCKFDPTSKAPNAAYFTFQAIGGGGGGSYPIYDKTLLEHRNTAYESGADIQLETNNYSSSKNYSYLDSINEAMEFAETQWIKEYFPPVKMAGSLSYCSAAGSNGSSNIGFDPIYDDEEDPSKQTGWKPNFVLGGIGGPGVCITVPYGALQISSTSSVSLTTCSYSSAKNPCKRKYGYKEDYYDSCNYLTDYDLNLVDGATDVRIDKTENVPFACNSIQSYNCGSSYGISGDGISCTIPTGYDGLSRADGDTGSVPPRGYLSYADIYASCPAAAQGLVTITGNNPSSTGSCDVPTEGLFPETISMKQSLGYDTPTYGYAGRPGESVSMMLPKLVSNLELEIGTAGLAGVRNFENGKGGNGEDTVIWTKEVDNSTKCTDGNSNCKRVFTAKGGLGLRGGVAASKIFMRGDITAVGGEVCELKTLDNGVSTYIDGCLDNGVARIDEAKKRFSTSSGFYTIPEMDENSKTPSAIDAYYRKHHTLKIEGIDTTYSPGTGGDGGYSFLTYNNGRELVVARGHNNFNKSSLAAIGKNDPRWYNTTAADGAPAVGLNYTNTITYAMRNNYRCYRATDEFGKPSGGGLNSTDPSTGEKNGFEAIDLNKVYACVPTRGYPGAVVIVW